MQPNTGLSVKELDTSLRQAAETLLGRSLKDDERAGVFAFSQPQWNTTRAATPIGNARPLSSAGPLECWRDWPRTGCPLARACA